MTDAPTPAGNAPASPAPVWTSWRRPLRVTEVPRPRRDTEWWLWPLLLVLPIASTTWFATVWPGARWREPWDPRTPDLFAWRHAGEMVLAREQVYAGAHPWTGTPFGALTGIVWTWFSPWSMQWLFCALVAVIVTVLLERAGLRGWALTVAAAVVCGLGPLHLALGFGHLNVLLLGLVALDLLRTPRRVPMGLATGLAIALDPILAPVAVMLVFAGRVRAMGAAAVSFVAATVFARWWLPGGSTSGWLTMAEKTRFAWAKDLGSRDHQSLIAAVWRTLAPTGHDHVLTLTMVCAAAAVVTCAAAGIVWRDHNPWLAVGVAGLVCTSLDPLAVATGSVFALPLVIGAVRRGVPSALRAASLAYAVWVQAAPWTTVKGRETYAGQELVAVNGTAGWIVVLSALTIGSIFWTMVLRRGLPQPVAVVWRWLTRAAVAVGVVLVAWYAAAVFLEPFHKGWIAWQPRMPDFAVYVKAAHAFVSGGDIYAAGAEEWPFLYPPIAAALMAPLAWFELGTVQAGWLALTALALLALGHRLGLNGWINGFLVALGMLACGPLHHNMGLGQISILLMVGCLLDTVEGPRWFADRWPALRLPAGIWIGLGAAIKLTPAVFIPFLLLTGRRRAAAWATGTFAAATAAGFAIAPARSWHYWTTIASGNLQFFPDTRGWLHNQSLQSAVQRYLGVDASASRLGLLLGLTVAGLALLAGVRWALAGHELLGASLTGLAMIAAVPVSWHHYYVWVAPLAIAVVRRGVPSALRAMGLLWAGWCSTAPFWALPTDDRIRKEFAYLDEMKLSAGAAAFGMIAVVVIALICARPIWERLAGLVRAGLAISWRAGLDQR